MSVRHAFILPLSYGQTRRHPPLLSRRRPLSNSQTSRATRACASPAPRSTDPRGFVLPEEGDVVLYQGRWANEDAAGLVSSIRFVESRAAHVVDIVELRRLSSDLFAMPRASSRRGKPARWMDVAEVRVVPDATYVPGQDAYRVAGTRDGYAPVAPLDDEARRVAEAEYKQLKQALMRDTLTGGAAGTVFGALFGGAGVARAFASGATASAVYLAMLQGGVDAVGKGGLAARLLGLRFVVPVLPFVGLSVAAGGLSHGTEGLLGSLSKVDALAIVLGLLTYKIPLFLRTGGEFVDGLAEFEMGKTGMVGTAVGLAAREIKKRRDNVPEAAADVASMKDTRKLVFVFAGPSGVGKSTFIHRLMDDYPDRFDFSVSHTTRPMREGEENGVDYSFVDVDVFKRMIDEGSFVEFANVHGQYYGTSYEAVNAVLSEGNVCILDLDVQGVDALRSKSSLDWDARFIWIAPPSISALQERLLARGTETAETLKTRLDTATRELTYAATNDVFDLTIINDDVDRAYDELQAYINKTSLRPE